MNLDIRYPLGMIFLAIGAVMTVYGIFTRSSAIYVASEGMNINLIWGVIMVLFGAVMFGLAKYASLNPPPPAKMDPNAPKRPSMH